MTIDVERIATGLCRGRDGIWYAKEAPAVSYPEDGNELCAEIEAGSFWFEHRNRCILEAVRLLPPEGPIFDLGGGNGWVASALLAGGFDSVLVEPGPAGARTAKRERRIPQVICATVESAGFSPGSLPAVGLFDVLEHVEDDRAFLARLAALLRPRGRIYLTVPAHRLLWSRVDADAGHFRRYSRRALAGRLSEAGLEVEYLTYFFGLLPLPILLFRTLPSLLGLRRRRSARRLRRDHLAGGSPLRRPVSALLAREVGRIRRRRRMALGASLLAVARLPGRTTPRARPERRASR